jgi:hypothetical protein
MCRSLRSVDRTGNSDEWVMAAKRARGETVALPSRDAMSSDMTRVRQACSLLLTSTRSRPSSRKVHSVKLHDTRRRSRRRQWWREETFEQTLLIR